MKMIYILAILLFVGGGLKAQLIDNKLNVHLSYQQHLTNNENILVRNEGFTAPSLPSNMRSISALSAKGLYTYRAFMSLGIGTDLTSYTKWSYEKYRHYSESSIQEITLYPILQLHPPFRRKGLLNRFKPNIQLSPVLGLAKADFEQPLMEVVANNVQTDLLMAATDAVYGIKATAGIEISVHRLFGITASYGYRDLWLSPQLYHDEKISQSFLEAGIYILMYKNKRYYY